MQTFSSFFFINSKKKMVEKFKYWKNEINQTNKQTSFWGPPISGVTCSAEMRFIHNLFYSLIK